MSFLRRTAIAVAAAAASAANQRFRFLQAGSATCTTPTFYDLCGIRDRQR
jgi:hypothetical protein